MYGPDNVLYGSLPAPIGDIFFTGVVSTAPIARLHFNEGANNIQGSDGDDIAIANFRFAANPAADSDGDGVKDVADNCPLPPNADQLDTDGDGQGDVCDPDDDNDGSVDEADNCPITANPGQDDLDGDGIGDACDADRDADGVGNGADICGETPVGEVVDPDTGCSIAQLCPCEGPRGTTEPWKNHGQYVSCVAKSTDSFVEQDLITEAEKDAPVSAATGVRLRP